MKTCPTCGQLLPATEIEEADHLLMLLTEERPHRQVYLSQGRHWYVSYGGGRFSKRAVERLVASGAISSVYSNSPKECFHVGRTIDSEATAEARNRLGKKAAPIIYVDEPRDERWSGR